MTLYERLCRRRGVFRRLTGLSVKEFEALYEQVEGAIEDYEERRLSRRQRQRATGAGGKYELDTRERLLMAMIWLRLYPTYDVLGFLFDLDKSNVGRNLKRVLAVLREQLGDEVKWPDKERRKQKAEAFMQEFPEVVAIVDATEQPTQRPKDKEGSTRKSVKNKVTYSHVEPRLVNENSQSCESHRRDGNDLWAA